MMKKKNSNFLFKLSVITLSVLCLTSCSEEEQLIGKWIGIFVGVVAAMLILNMILEYLAIKLAYIYWPACLIASIIIFYSEMRGGLAGDLKGMPLSVPGVVVFFSFSFPVRTFLCHFPVFPPVFLCFFRFCMLSWSSVNAHLYPIRRN